MANKVISLLGSMIIMGFASLQVWHALPNSDVRIHWAMFVFAFGMAIVTAIVSSTRS